MTLLVGRKAAQRPQRTRGFAVSPRLLACVLATVATPAWAAGAVFDKPVALTAVPGAEGREVVCTDYGDLGVVELRDGPSSEPAVLVGGGVKSCGAAAAERGVKLDTADMALAGRVGPLLIFSQMDPHGAVGFAVVRARDGEVVMREAATGDPLFRSARVLADGSVSLKYTRAVNAPCSLLADAAGCWDRLASEGIVPGALAKRSPRANICARAYEAVSAPRDDPSIVSWDQETIFEAGGDIAGKSFGEKIGCDALP
ncbi:hypothetical protein [Pinisolibacter sp.]|uniref:hypothetical protein n=1 Tax=Pinisolibacter sp. TaxID=2172024 RepID=UPI002FDE5F25